ncbi:MAG: class I SAM-dependent methyltransferase [Desulfobacterales bacterium]|nr:class I SAM-dependent methyltransferase [Desulfobacterales bacterium]
MTLETAQENMLSYIINHFPGTPASVLHVGCGLGRSAYYLAENGYKVTAMESSQELIDYASDTYKTSRIDFHAGSFLDENDPVFISKKYDVIFFQESLKHLNPLSSVFERARTLLKPGGVVIIGDEICHDQSLKKGIAVHFLKFIVTALLENGFRITSNNKIDNNVVKTFDIISKRFEENFKYQIPCLDQKDIQDRLEFIITRCKSSKKIYEDNIGYYIFIAKKDIIFVREYEDGDEFNILKLFKKAFNTTRAIEHWYWKFRDNPFGAYKIAETITEDGTLAAHFSGYPAPFYSSVGELKEFFAFQGADVMSNKKFRNIGLGRTSVLARASIYHYNKHCIHDIPFIYAFSTGTMRKFGERFLQYQFTSPITYHVMDLSKVKLKKMSTIKRILSGFTIEEVYEITREYDLFFEKVCNDYGMLVKRTSSYLKWRYLDCPDNYHRMFALRRFGKLVGWSVFSLRDNVLIWGDALFDKKDAYIVGFMISYLIKVFFQNTVRIEGWFALVPKWWSNILKDTGFEVKDEPNKLAPTFIIFDPRFDTHFFEQYFYYTMGDSDLF